MLFYYLYWMIMGFIIHFYITFGTNLLTGGPVHIVVLLPISVFRRKGISNGGSVIFGMDVIQETWSWSQGSFKVAMRVGGTPPYWARPLSRGPLERPLFDFFHLYIPIYPKNIRDEDRSGVLPPQVSVATKNQWGPCSGTLPEGESLIGGNLHHPDTLHDE